MWRRGNRRADNSAEGIERVYYAVVSALTQLSEGPPAPDYITFDHEWTRMAAVVVRQRLHTFEERRLGAASLEDSGTMPAHDTDGISPTRASLPHKEFT
jgi:hypothetical protein